MNYAHRRFADRKLTCARCKEVTRVLNSLRDCRYIVARMSLPEASEYDKSELPQWKEILRNVEDEAAGEVYPDTLDIKRGEECMYVALSGAHYLHLACAERYLDDIKKVL